MKHEPKITPEGAKPASESALHLHMPDPEQCQACNYEASDCSRLGFDQMPILSIHKDGTAFVNCLSFDKGVSRFL